MEDVKLDRVFILEVEEAGDFIFVPSGVVFVTERHRIQLYCASSNHNRYRAALVRHQWEELENGVRFRDTEYRLNDITQEMTDMGWRYVSASNLILRHLYVTNQRNLFFLERYTHLSD